MPNEPFTAAVLDRVCGVLLATAAGDALGAPYELGPPLGLAVAVRMGGGGSPAWAAGEWTDDTAMAVAIAEVAATGADLRTVAAQDAIVDRWVQWIRDDPRGAGAQTTSVLAAVGAGRGSSSAHARAAATALHRNTGRSGGNGSLMRTAPVALAYLHDADGLVEAAAALSTLTHADPEAAEACVLWCLAVRHAVLTGELDVRTGLARLEPERGAVWAERLDAAEASRPADFAHNGWVVEAVQAAWSAIATTPVPTDDPAARTFRADHLRLALEAAVRGGNDTDTVAAIAGGLLGAVHGASAVPAAWRRMLHGWPGIGPRELNELASAIVRGGRPDKFDSSYRGYPGIGALARHPYDDGVWLGGVGALRSLPPGVDAVVSLCRVGDADVPPVGEFVEVRLIDRIGADNNPNLDFVLDDTVTTIEQLRAAGRTVLVHCVQAHSRTPTIGALYGMRLRGVPAEQALADIRRVLPGAQPNSDFRAALQAAAVRDGLRAGRTARRRSPGPPT